MCESFQPTRNSLLEKACDSCEDVRRKAINELIHIYRAPLATFLKVNGWRYGVQEKEAEDILQSFVLEKFLERSVFTRFKRKKGVKFRSFLIRVLVYYAINYETLRKQPDRGIPLDDLQLPDVATVDPARSYDISWARRVVRETLALMEAECCASRRPDLWAVFVGRLAGPILEGLPPTSYEELATRFRLAEAHHVHSLLITAKRKYRRALRSVVGQYSSGKAEIDEEIRELMRILAQADGHRGDSQTAKDAGEDR